MASSTEKKVVVEEEVAKLEEDNKPKAKPRKKLSQAELANQMKNMQELVARQRKLEKEIEEKGGDDNLNALSHVLGCIRGLSVHFNENMRTMPGLEAVIKSKFDFFTDSVNKARRSIDALFEVENVKSIIQMSDGYSPHLTSPEKAIRMLIAKSFEAMEAPSKACIDEIAEVLLTAITDVIELMQGEWAEDYPQLRACLSELSGECVEEWKKAGETLVNTFVSIEQNAPDHRFFRDLSRKKIQCHTGDRSDSSVHPMGLGSGNGRDNEYLMGYLEKRTHRSQKWQKRWFVLSENRKVLYYFVGPQSIKPQAAIPLEEVEVVELVNTPRTSQYGPGSACKIFRLKNSDSNKSVLPHKKDGQPRTLTVIAPNPQSKQEWVEAIKKCCAKYTSMEEEDANAEEEEEGEQQQQQLLDLDSVSQASASPKDLQRQGALRRDDTLVQKLQDMKEEKQASESDYAEHADDVRSIASVHSSFKDASSFQDGRTLHLVLPFVPGITSVKNPEDEYIKSLIASTKTYVNDIFTQLTCKIPKAVSYSMIDECKKRAEGKISKMICSMSEAELQALLGKDPSVVEEVMNMKAELGQVKGQLDTLLECTC
jgi:hypothetical protein